jgi:hypothetical protein
VKVTAAAIQHKRLKPAKAVAKITIFGRFGYDISNAFHFKKPVSQTDGFSFWNC